MSLELQQQPRDVLRSGLGNAKSDRNLPVHPVDVIQRSFEKQQRTTRRFMVANIYGSHFAIRLQAEEAILSQFQRMPGLTGSNVALETVLGLEDKIEFEDYLLDSRTSERPIDDFLVAMENRMGENLNSVLQ